MTLLEFLHKHPVVLTVIVIVLALVIHDTIVDFASTRCSP